MRLLIIRHGDPDYAIDGLTEKGKREAALLSDKLCREKIDSVYCSTLGRAKLTIEPTLERLGINAEYCTWLREFNYVTLNPELTDKPYSCPWDILPEYVSANPDFYHTAKWRELDCIKGTGIPEAYDEVCRELDACLEKHGYKRDGVNYKVLKPNHDTIVLVCHFGLASVLLSHLMNCSPYSVWQHSCALTSSVTTIYTEERREGIALMRMCGFSDISHLYAGGEKPSFMARFSECYTDGDRND